MFNNLSTATYTYNLFKQKEGSDHIASLNCLGGIIRYVKWRCPEAILELGIGIGTIPFALQEAVRRNELENNFKYYGTEADQFCIEAFRKNVPGYQHFINHFFKLADVPTGQMFDFIIVDGRDSNFDKIINFLNRRGIIIVEGGRSSQTSFIDNAKNKRKFLKYSNIAFSIKAFGGYTIYLFEPSILDYFWFMHGKISTFIKWKCIALIRPLLVKFKI